MKYFIKTIAALITLLVINGWSGSMNVQSQTLIGNPWMPNGNVKSITKHGDIVYVGGEFTAVGRLIPNGALLNAQSGAINYNTSAPDGEVTSVQSDGNGGFFIGGHFSHVGGVSRNGLAYINTDGTVGAFNPTLTSDYKRIVAVNSQYVIIASSKDTFTKNIYCVTHSGNLVWSTSVNGNIIDAVIKNNTLYVAGGFTVVGGLTRKKVAAFDIDGGNILSWNIGDVIPQGASNSFIWLGASDSELFITYLLAARTTISVSLASGQLNSWNTTSIRNKMTVHNGKIYAQKSGGGIIIIDVVTKEVLTMSAGLFQNIDFRIVASGNTIYLVRTTFSTDSSIADDVIAFDETTKEWLPFKTRILKDADSANPKILNAFAVGGDKAFVGGRFASVGAEKRERLYSYNSVTGELTSFAPQLDLSPEYLLATSTKLYASGFFERVNNQDRFGLASFDLATGILNDWNPILDASPAPMSVQLAGDDERIYLCGPFSTVNNLPRPGIAAFGASSGDLLDWSPEGIDASVVTATNGTMVALNGYIGLPAAESNKIFFLNRNTVAQILPPISVLFNETNAGQIHSMIIANNKLFVSGNFTFLKQGSTLIPRHGLAAIDLTSGDITDWQPDIFEYSNQIKLSYNNGIIYAAGSFTKASRQVRKYLAAFDEVSGELTQWYPVTNYGVMDAHQMNVVLATDNGVYVAGRFDYLGNEIVSNLAQVTLDNSNVIMGRVFYDTNSNGVMDGSEVGASNILMEIQPGNIFYPTDNNGNYKAYVGLGNFTVKPIGPAYTVSILPTHKDFLFNSGLQSNIGNDFALRVQTGVSDMSVVMSNSTAARPGFAVKYSIDYKNDGTLASNGTVSLTLDHVFEFIGSTPAPSLINDHHYEWNFTNLAPSEANSIKLNLKLPPNVSLLGRELTSKATVSTLNDIRADHNESDLKQIVTGSYDPNDKLVTPIGYGSEGFVPQNISSLLYTIRFQNMGTDTAFNVVVRDYLDPNLDVSSFNMISASHACSYTIINGEVVWQFDNIQLPHSSNDEPGSHGYITYSISPVNDHLPEGTVIQNGANIYFDFNPPVPTNTVINTIKNPPYVPVDINIGNASGEKGDEVVVPITVKSFKNILASQFSLAWDPSVATLKQVEELNSIIALNDFGTTQTNSGKLMFAWADAGLVAQTLPDDAVLFAIRFTLIGNYGASTALSVTNNPTPIEMVDVDQNVVPTRTQSSIVEILSTVKLKGKVSYSNDESIQNVTLNVTGADIQSAVTSADGSYQLDIQALNPSDNYVITPSKNDPSPLNGVDVADVAAIHRHILRTQIFTSAHQTIAADVNDSRSVSVLDMTLIKALILATNTGYPTNTFWKFFPANHIFTSVSNPFPYPQNMSMTATQIHNTQADFKGLKLGDVNMSRDNSQSARTAVEQITFDIRKEMEISDPTATGIIEIPVRIKKFENISGYQFTVKWNTETLELVSFNNQSVNSMFGTNQQSKGFLSVLWHNEEGTSTTLADYSKLFVLNFRSINNGGYKDVSITDDLTATRVYDNGLQLVNHKVSWSEPSVEDYNEKTRMYPNPFSESLNIEFYSSEKQQAELEITDFIGRAVYRSRVNAEKGMNKIQLQPSIGSGMYVVNLHTSNGGQFRLKVVKSE